MEKKFLILGNKNTFCCKEIFPLFRDGKIWSGVDNKNKDFLMDGELIKVNACWITNLPNLKYKKPLELTAKYCPEKYPKFDNYPVAINVNRTKDIPADYDGIIGVPISFILKYHPDQFEIIGIGVGNAFNNYPETMKLLGFKKEIKSTGGMGTVVLNGRSVFTRIFIKKR